MITIQSYISSSNSSHIRDINNENSILIIGKASNSACLNEFIKPKSLDDAVNIFGQCDLTDAYADAINAGAKNVFVSNCFKTSDFISSIDFLSQYNFSYIVPIGIKLSDKFFSEKYEKEMYFAEYYLYEFSRNTNTLVIFTDEHSKNYQNINHYLSDMNRKVMDFKDESSYLINEYGKNLAFCLNSLEDKLYANVILAAELSKTNVGEYPAEVRYTSTFDFNKNDMNESEIIFFQNNTNIGVTIENLNNFRTINDANKVITIFNVIRYIERNIDMSFALGKLYNSYTEMNIRDYIDTFLRRLLNTAIREYYIKKINFVPTTVLAGCISIEIEILPINSLESIDVLLEVK